MKRKIFGAKYYCFFPLLGVNFKEGSVHSDKYYLPIYYKDFSNHDVLRLEHRY